MKIDVLIEVYKKISRPNTVHSVDKVVSQRNKKQQLNIVTEQKLFVFL